MADQFQSIGKTVADQAVRLLAKRLRKFGTSQVTKAYRESQKTSDLQQVHFERAMTLTGHQPGPGRYQGKSVYAIDAHGTAGLLVTGGADGTVRTWPTNGTPGRIIHALAGRNSIRCVAFAPDGRLAIGGDDKRIVIIEQIPAGTEEVRISASFSYRQAIDQVAWSADGSRLAASTRGGHVLLCAPASGGMEVLVSNWLDAAASHPCLRFAPGDRAVARNVFDTVTAITFAGEPANKVRAKRQQVLGGFAFSPAGDLVAVGLENGAVHVLDWPSGEPRHVLRSHDSTPLGAQVTAMAFSADGALLASAGLDGTIKIWRPSDGLLLGSQSCGTGVNSMIWSAPRRIAVATGREGQVWSVTG